METCTEVARIPVQEEDQEPDQEPEEEPDQETDQEPLPMETLLDMCVGVQTMDGEQLEVYMNLHATVADLKEWVAELWLIPSTCQRIIVGAGVAADSERLDKLGVAGKSASPLTMIVAIDPLMGVLKHGSSDEIVVALHDLAQLGERCGESAYIAIVGCSKNKNTAIKVAALQALAQLGDRGSDDAYVAIVLCMKNPLTEVRVAALQALTAVTHRGHVDATSQILSSMLDWQEVVRCTAVKALGMIASRGHCFAMDAAASVLHGTDFKITAMFALKFIAETGDKNRIASTIEHFRDSHCEIHLRALEALGELTESGSTEAVVAVTTCLLRQMHNDALCIALEQLVALANQGDLGALFSVIACLRDNAELSDAAMSALVSVVERGKPHVVAVITECMETADLDEWTTLVEAMSVVAEEGSDHAMTSISIRLKDEHWQDRRMAFIALRAILSRGDPHAHKRASGEAFRGIQDENSLVKRAAFEIFDVLHK